MDARSEITRRNFLKKTAFISGSTAVIGSLPWIKAIAENPASASSSLDKVNIGIIGVGTRGKKLLLHFLEMENVNVVAFCDVYQPNYDRAVQLTGGKTKGYTDYLEMIARKDIDGIVIATPVFLHPEMTINSLQAGKHVFCEKAMSNTAEEAKAMVEAHKATGKNLQIGHQRLFDPKYLKALEKVRSGEFGPITHIRANWYLYGSWRREVPAEFDDLLNWRIKRKYSLGLMTELASHQTQVANWFIGKVPVSVSGSGSINYWKDGRDTFDSVNVVYSYDDGSHLQLNSHLSNWHYGLEEQVMGPKATMELEEGKFYLQSPPPPPGIVQLISNVEKSVFETIPIGGPSWVKNTGSKMKGEYLVDERDYPEATTLELEAFVQSIKDNKQIPGILEEGYWGSIAAILGNQAMEEKKVIFFTDDLKIL